MNSKKCRKVILNLTDDDTDALCRKAGSAGLTVPVLIENFIVDLIDGTGSNGSDERMYANEWFDRCWFGYAGFQTFLGFLIDNLLFDEMVAYWEELNYLQSLENPDEDETDDIHTIQKELEEMFQEYTESVGTDYMDTIDATLDEGLTRISAWIEERELLVGREDAEA